MRVAIAGFKHGHMRTITRQLRAHPEFNIVAVAENDPGTYENLMKELGLKPTHESAARMLEEVEFDVLAVGDAFGARGPIVISAMESGKHILADKPLCIRYEEFERIRSLAQSKGLSVIVALTLRYRAEWRTARRLLREGVIGKVVAVTIFGQHPLNYRAGRPDWYFEKGMHGGTFNDILVHGVDLMHYLTGKRVAEVIAARAWNGGLPEVPHFQDMAQALLRLENDAGVIADVSYKAPMGHPAHCAIRFWGIEGSLSVEGGADLVLRRHHESEKRITPDPAPERSFVDDLAAEIRGEEPREAILTTAECLDATGRALLIQRAADERLTNQVL